MGVEVEPAGVLEFAGVYGVGAEWGGELQPVAFGVGTNVEVLAVQGQRAEARIGEREALRLRFRADLTKAVNWVLKMAQV